ncbi:DUF2497 domain-containing protein [Nordella sp. HKS 07]|uniref:PopZ family protein n=1 Tax=Nordella sp. HKS 07 TaxID=2712222 RepID=UPI0013E1142E|nr:DUF2497 domain-containing protein [Nordella sp. HKS 07]QIG51536.1 DUF2497 domain-containing protein [Nordella sp. HKS 07]
MKHGQKPAEPRMEDVLASIRRAIDENAAAASSDRFGDAMADLRGRVEPPPARPDNRARRSYDYSSTTASQQSQPQGFAGILGGRREETMTAFRERASSYETRLRRPDPVLPEPVLPDDQDQYSYDGYFGAQAAEYVEPEPEPESEAYPSLRELDPPRFLPPAPAPAVIAEEATDFALESGLMSESTSSATQAAFAQLAETITRRALGDRPIADIAQELLRGMLKQWLDENLPKLVERLVREEIERVVRRPQR